MKTSRVKKRTKERNNEQKGDEYNDSKEWWKERMSIIMENLEKRHGMIRKDTEVDETR